MHGLNPGQLQPSPKGKDKYICVCYQLLQAGYLYLYLRGVGQSRPELRPCMFGPMCNPNTTKGQEILLMQLSI